MDYLLEDPTPALAIGALLITVGGILYFSLRTNATLIGLAAAVLLAVGGVAIEVLVQTPREQAVSALDGLLSAVEANDLPAVRARIAPSATGVLDDANRMMPEVFVEKANRIGEVAVSLEEGRGGPIGAELRCRVFAKARHRRSGTQGGDMIEIRFHFVRSADGWLLDSYSGSGEWQRGVAELRSKR